MTSTLVNVAIQVINQICSCKIADFWREVVFHDEMSGFCRLVINDELYFVSTMFHGDMISDDPFQKYFVLLVVWVHETFIEDLMSDSYY